MNILVSNDDGINAEGLRRLVGALSELGDVYVFAPDRQRSASSHALSIGRPIIMKKQSFPLAIDAYAVGGTPADCVKLGINWLEKQGIKVDIVYAGINHGANLGTDCIYSGTVSAAAEGAFAGKPAVAVSVESHVSTHFDGACNLAVKVFPFAMELAGTGKVVSINTPDIPEDEIKDVLPAYIGKLDYDECVSVLDEGGADITYEYTGQVKESAEWTEETDAFLVRRGYATISMIRYDLNDYEGTKKLKNWEIKLR